MKSKFFIIISLALLASCSKINFWENNKVTPSQNELTFSYESGEQEVNIISEADWYCEYDADWLIVRQQQDKIRVIVEENTSETSRTSIISLLVDEKVQNEIKVTQTGIGITVDNQSISANSMGETFTIPIQTNAPWTVENPIEWCCVQKESNNLVIEVDRNYKMAERTGFINVHATDLSSTLTITQSGCEWYESFEMVVVEGGIFYMGAQKENPDGLNYDASAYEIESPVHQVTVSDFSIGKFEVTQAQWTAAMGSNPSTNQGDNLPVENVTWEQVQEFITLLNENSGLNYRLPTEAEWEFAAKGGNSSEGFLYSGYSVLGACGWYYSNSESTTHDIGSKAPNELGIYDMSGNVREWCNDWLDYYSTNNENDPQGPSSGNLKVNRGGSWTTPAVNCRNTYRHSNYPSEASQDLGFRLAISL